MRCALAWLLGVAAVAAGPVMVAAQGGEGSEPGPSLEYKPPRQVLPEPKAPTPAPPVTIFRYTFGTFGIGAGAFNQPVDVVADDEDYLYVLDAGNNRVQMFDRSNKFVAEWGAYGSRPGEFSRPGAIAVGPGGFIYVVDTGNHRVQQFLWVSPPECPNCLPERPDGKRLKLMSTWGSLGARSGDFKDPRDITFEGGETIWVLDAGNERVQSFHFDPRRMKGTPPEFADEFGRDVRTRGGSFTDLVSLAWSDERFGYLYLLGPGCVVQQFKTDGTLEGTWAAVAPETEACVPARMESDNVGRYLYVLDSGNGLLARFHREGRFLSAVRSADRAFSHPRGFALLSDGDEFAVADTGNNIVQKYSLR